MEFDFLGLCLSCQYDLWTWKKWHRTLETVSRQKDVVNWFRRNAQCYKDPPQSKACGFNYRNIYLLFNVCIPYSLVMVAFT